MAILSLISQATGLSEEYLWRLTKKAPHCYRHYTIPKRNGETRDIYHPTPELKLLQHWLTENIFSALPVHQCVYSYRSGINILRHANQHKKSNYLLRLDVQEFFPSITGIDVEKLLKRRIDTIPVEIEASDIKLIAKIVCRKPNASKPALRLTIGAPSSPSISNAILFEFDEIMYDHCLECGVIYTRYADDLYFSTSTPGILSNIETFVKKTLKSIKSPKLRLNTTKTVFTSRKRRRVVTGVTLTSDKKLSIGRGAKRQVRTEIYLLLTKKLEPEKVANLRGRLCYYRSVEPTFIDSLSKKFGEDRIFALMKGLEIEPLLPDVKG
jgi:RNA-directed DNA polymerase